MKKSEAGRPLTTCSPTEQFERRYVKPQPGSTLIVGSLLNGEREDRRKLYPHAIGLDMQGGPGVDIVHNLEAPLRLKFAHVECISVLEHCRKPWVVASNIEDAMNVGSTIHLSVPFAWRWHGYPSDYFRFTADGIRELFPRIDWHRLMYASDRLSVKHLLHVRKDGNHPLLPRCEVMGFGRRL